MFWSCEKLQFLHNDEAKKELCTPCETDVDNVDNLLKAVICDLLHAGIRTSVAELKSHFSNH